MNSPTGEPEGAHRGAEPGIATGGAVSVTRAADLDAALERALRVVTEDRRQALLDVRIID